jgi:3-hydroxybutyryl-CoA dehydratase
VEKSRFFEELVEGEEFRSPTRTIAEYDLYVFAGLTGDMTDFHISTEAARHSVFGQRAAHGMLLISIANGLYNRIGITDETGMALAGVEWRFLAPGFIGDTVHLVARVKELREVSKKDRGLVFWDARLLKQDGTVVCQGQMIRMVRRRSPA